MSVRAEMEEGLHVRTHLRLAAGAALLLTVALSGAAAAATQFSNGFETNTNGWFDYYNGSISRVASGYTNGGGYADGIASSAGGYHARLGVAAGPPDNCLARTQSSACYGPYTEWGGEESIFPANGYTTQVDIYLDTSWATTHVDYRFDWDSAINDNTGNFLSDFVFNVGTDPLGSGAFYVSTSPNAFRSSTFPENPCPSPSSPPNSCRPPAVIATSGWYTFRHSFRNDAGTLAVEFTVLDHSGSVVPGADWTILSAPISGVGGHAYGWFAQNEIGDLAIDDSLLSTQVGPPTSKDQCKDGGWQSFNYPRTFMNQGDCIQYVNTGK